MRSRALGQPSLPLIRQTVSTARVTAVEPQQPGYLSHRRAAAAPLGHISQRQTLILGHGSQRLPSAALSVPDESIAFTQRSGAP